MANLDSTNIIGKLRVSEDAIINGSLKVTQIVDKDGNTGSNGQVLKTDGSELYWGTDNATTGGGGSTVTDTNQKVKAGSVTFGADDTIDIVAGTNVTVSGDKTNKKITISSSYTDTDTKVTSAANHYSPSAVAASELTATLSGTVGAYAKDTEYTVLTGVKAQRDNKGHITGLTYTAQKIKDTNTDTNTKMRLYRQTSGYNGDYPILVSRTAASSIGTAGSNGSNTAIYAVMSDTVANVPTINPISGEAKIPTVTSPRIYAEFYYTNTGVNISTLYAAKATETAAANAANTVKLDTATTTNGTYFVPISSSTVATAQVGSLNRSNSLTFNPSTGKLSATSFDGECTGRVTGKIYVTALCGTSTSSTDRLYFIGTQAERAVSGGTDFTPYTTSGCYIRHNRYYAAGTSVGSADYAEFFEWADGNLEEENRLGLFVSFSEDCPKQIRIATPEDEDILGIVSAQPAILGNCAEDEWVGKYQRDVWGRVIVKTVEIPATYDEKGNELSKAATIEEPQLSLEFDPEREYIPRGARSEWAPIGLLGVLVVQDDGTCIAGRYCKCGEGGVATFSQKGGWRVLERVDDTHVRVYFK